MRCGVSVATGYSLQHQAVWRQGCYCLLTVLLWAHGRAPWPAQVAYLIGQESPKSWGRNSHLLCRWHIQVANMLTMSCLYHHHGNGLCIACPALCGAVLCCYAHACRRRVYLQELCRSCKLEATPLPPYAAMQGACLARAPSSRVTETLVCCVAGQTPGAMAVWWPGETQPK